MTSQQMAPVERVRQILSAATFPVIAGTPAKQARGYYAREHSDDGSVMICPVLDGRVGAPAGAILRGRGVEEWRAMNRAALDAVTAEGWERIEDTWDGNVFRAPTGPLDPMVKETIHVLERHGSPGYAKFDVSRHGGAVRIDVAGGYNSQQLSLSDVALPALTAAGFHVETVHEGERAERKERNTLHHLFVRPPVHRRQEWALAHTVRRLLQSRHRHVRWDVRLRPALPDHMPESSAPGAEDGALVFQFSGHAVHGPRAFDSTLQDTGFAIAPSRHPWWRILRPAPDAQ